MDLSFESILSPGGLIGNLSYVLLIVSMAMRDMFWLRLIAIFSGLTGIAYDALWLNNAVGVFWESCFVLVNVVQWGVLVHEKRRNSLSVEEDRLREFLLPSLSRAAFRKLLDVGAAYEVPPGTALTRQGEPVPRLILLTQGTAEVAVNGEVIATCRAGDLVGEIGFLTRRPATASVTSRTDVCFHAFDGDSLTTLLERSHEIGTAFSKMCSTNLADKLTRSNASPRR